MSIGLVLILNALTGLTLLVGRPADEAFNARLFKVQPAAQAVPLEGILQALRTDFPTQALTLRPGQAPDDSLAVNVRSDRGWEGRVFIDPYTGQRLGARERSGLSLEGVFELHSALLAGSTGKSLLGIAALGMVFMLASGLYLWWPVRWRQAFSVTVNGSRLRALFDLHRVGGAVLGLWVLVCVATGGLLAYRPASQWINQLAGAAAIEPPKAASIGSAATVATLDALVAAATRAVPEGEIRAIVLPAKANGVVRIRKKLPDDPHPVGLTSIWLRPTTGAVLRVDRWNQLAPGERMFAWVYPLHSGQLAGVIGTLLDAIGGLALLGFGATGSWLWWTRRSARRAQAAKAAR